MSRHWKTLCCFVMLFNIDCSQLTCWCVVKIAAGGEILGLEEESRGVIVRIVLWLIYSSQQLVPGRFWALSFCRTWVSIAQPSLESDVCDVSAFPREGACCWAARPLRWCRGKISRSTGEGERMMAAAEQEKGTQLHPLWHPVSLAEGVSCGCALAVLLEQTVFWRCLGPTP